MSDKRRHIDDDSICLPCSSVRILLLNARILDVEEGKLLPDVMAVRICDGTITDILSDATPLIHEAECSPTVKGATTVIDVEGRTLMPGLMDMHVHVTAWSANFRTMASQSTAYATARAGAILRNMLLRGFTTVRDAGGADFGLAQAVDEGFLLGPRLFFCGHAISQTGGHGDVRGPGEDSSPCLCQHGLGVVCDGVPEMRRACRNEIRKGATHLKLMVSGGVASPCDRIDSTQFAEDEITAAVEEARAANIHVMAHAYTARAVERALKCGVRSIEHGNLLDSHSVELLKAKNAFLVPTLATYQALAKEGQANGMPDDQHAKVFQVLDAGIAALSLAHKSGVKIAYGTDLLGDMHRHQLTEIAIRSQVQPAEAIIRSATCIAAELLGMEGKLGVVRVGAHADLLVWNGNPLEDLEMMQHPDDKLWMVMKGGIIYKLDADLAAASARSDVLPRMSTKNVPVNFTSSTGLPAAHLPRAPAAHRGAYSPVLPTAGQHDYGDELPVAAGARGGSARSLASHVAGGRISHLQDSVADLHGSLRQLIRLATPPPAGGGEVVALTAPQSQQQHPQARAALSGGRSETSLERTYSQQLPVRPPATAHSGQQSQPAAHSAQRTSGRPRRAQQQQQPQREPGAVEHTHLEQLLLLQSEVTVDDAVQHRLAHRSHTVALAA
ncbi:hypothetical protein CYMTET_3738 [Cymbomonas tetramitiformis]|uniref:Amidohydrolase-related domain-containing protein n=1 Tax=Cymbomonas tetramitiformis TaxID=36881 RepID=A0AAE0H4H3_9CHLO|nr:hypothetical protein CYMTET_3738 [Cymbomonas tetramitiformis]